MFSAQTTQVIAVGVAGSLGLGLLIYLACWVRRTRLSPLQALLYGYNYFACRLLWRATVSGPLPLPPGQGALILCNHRSPVDPAFVSLTTHRVVHWMVAKEYCLHPVLSWIFRLCEVIPVSRSGIDTKATKMAIRYAQGGGLVGLFPEGRINTTDQLLLPGRLGAAMIALKARVPVVPCYVSGTPFNGSVFHSLWTPAKVRLTIGQPIDLSAHYGHEHDREVLKAVTRRILQEIARLADEPDFEPQVARG